MKIENESTFRQYLSQGISLFLGAGFSILAKNNDGKNLPVASELAEELRREFDCNNFSSLSLPQLCTLIESVDQYSLKEYLKRRHTVCSYDSRYKLLDSLAIKTIFTTNIDDLVHKIYNFSSRHYVNDLNLRGPAFKDLRAVDYVALHGSVVDDAKPYRFDLLSIAEAFTVDPDLWRHLQLKMARSPLLFWGYSIQDAGTLQSLAAAARQSNPHLELWALIRPIEADESALALYKALRIQTVIGETDSFLDYISAAIPDINTAMSGLESPSSRGTYELFPDEAVPPIGATPSRPIKYFYSGMAPTWSDVYSGQIHKTMYFDVVKNKINGGQNVLIMGIPATGKTTLLMQLAADMMYSGHKLFLQSVTLEKAQMVVRRLAGEPALIFVDNSTDNVDAMEEFARNDNIRTVAADRDYNVFTAAHRLVKHKIDFVNITDLDPADMHSCVQGIPSEHRKSKFIRPRMSSDVQPSLFEVIELNSRIPGLRNRFRTMLKHLNDFDKDGLEFVLLTSYVHSCRTPVSMDMLLGYWYDEHKNYDDIYAIAERIGNTLSEYSGAFADENQDYYSMRSGLVSETVVEEASSYLMRQVVEKLHKNVSPNRICRYDVFCRRAYDADLFVRLYPQWEDGKAFYDSLYQRDNSPYTLQQAALFLSRKGKHSEAFVYIDRAISASGGRNWSIKNSHAIILFRANISFPNDINARIGLDESMKILSDCYKWDRRKPFHALTFADFSLKYHDCYQDDTSVDYLVRADEWLNKTIEEGASIRQCLRLKDYVGKRLRQIGMEQKNM